MGGDIVEHLGFELCSELLRDLEATHLGGCDIHEAKAIGGCCLLGLGAGGGAAREEPQSHERKGEEKVRLLVYHRLSMFFGVIMWMG